MCVSRRIGAVLISLLLLSACTMDTREAAFHPSFRAGPCPEDLEPILIPIHSCGFLTVLQDRSRPDGRTIDLFVVRVEPQAGRPTDRYPMYMAGTNLATSHQFFDLTQAAERLQRETIIMEPRGVGRSRPSLDCPEIDAISAGALKAGIGDRKVHAAFLDAVSACRTRLSEAGIDVAAYDLSAMAADAEDLRQALGIESWGIMTYGSASLVALAVLRDEPSHIAQMILDSPTFPQIETRMVAAEGTRYALDSMVDACSRDARCKSTYPRLGSALSRTIQELDLHPIVERSAGTAAAHESVRMDGTTLLRVLRTLLTGLSDSRKLEELATINSAAHGEIASNVMGLLTTESPFCVGFLPQCDDAHPVAEGTYLSVVCRDLAQASDATTTRVAHANPAYVDTFTADPWFQACARWDVPLADPSVSQPVSSDVPTLIVLGRFDPFAPAAIVERAAAPFTHDWIVVDPVGGHNALGHSSCMIEMRNDWSRHRSSPPDRSCIASMTSKPFDLDSE